MFNLNNNVLKYTFAHLYCCPTTFPLIFFQCARNFYPLSAEFLSCVRGIFILCARYCRLFVLTSKTCTRNLKLLRHFIISCAAAQPRTLEGTLLPNVFCLSSYNIFIMFVCACVCVQSYYVRYKLCYSSTQYIIYVIFSYYSI